mmetsp:Transcript_26982/g.55202  ORF Transcript_26982/g.55202 Transcript_26982/m.55202 type:complete len:439 (+) Transcript_26982:46-1362(+)
MSLNIAAYLLGCVLLFQHALFFYAKAEENAQRSSSTNTSRRLRSRHSPLNPTQSSKLKRYSVATSPRVKTMSSPGCLTINPKTDGFGSQYEALISVFAFAVRTGVAYCPTPWNNMAHGQKAMEMYRFVGGPLFLYKPPRNLTANETKIAKIGTPTSKISHVLRHAVIVLNASQQEHGRTETKVANFDRRQLAVVHQASHQACACRRLKDFQRDMLGSYHLAQPAIALVREHYFATPKPQLGWFAAHRTTPGATLVGDRPLLPEFHVAVHVRRGDIIAANPPDAAAATSKRYLLEPGEFDDLATTKAATSDVGDAPRFTSDEAFAACVGHVLAQEPGCRLNSSSRTCRVHLFSDANTADSLAELKTLILTAVTAANLPSLGVEVHVGCALKLTFHHLVSADALVMSNSALSSTAGLLSQGKIYAPFQGRLSADRHIRAC